MDASPLKCNAPTVMRIRGPHERVASTVLKGHGGFNKIKVVYAYLPDQIEDNHIEVEVYYCGINFTDNYVRLGIIRSKKFPIIMGSECVGVVVGVGKGVTDLKVGQRVLCLRMHGGLFRQYVHVPRSNCVLLPDEITMIDAACLGFDFLVAHLCLYEVAQIRDTDSIFVQSIAGGVGTSMVQLLRARSDEIKIYGTAAEPKHDDVLHLGANRVYTHEEDYVKDILEQHPEGVDIIINSNGGTDITKFLKLLKPFGRLMNIGSNSTAIYPRSFVWGVVSPTWDTKHMTPGEILDSNRKITGVNIDDLIESYPQRAESIVETVLEMFCCKRIRTRVHAVVPFAMVEYGLKDMCTRENTGKVLMFVQHEAQRTAVPRCPGSPREGSLPKSPRGSPEGGSGRLDEGAEGEEPDDARSESSLSETSRSEADQGFDEDIEEDEYEEDEDDFEKNLV